MQPFLVSAVIHCRSVSIPIFYRSTPPIDRVAALASYRIERVRQSTWESRYRYGGSESGASCRQVRPLKVAAMLAPILVCVEQHLEWATPVHQPAWVYCVSAPALSAHCCFWPAALNQTPAPAPAPAHQHYIACNRPPRHASAPTQQTTNSNSKFNSRL